MLVKRHSQNPILERDTIIGYDTLFNPGAMRFQDKIVLAVRATRDYRKLTGSIGTNYLYIDQVCDHLLFESFNEGKTFNLTQYKVTGTSSTWIDGCTGEISVPSYFGPYGTEDLRLCRIGDLFVGVTHVMTHPPYTGDGKAGGRIGLVVTKDFRHYKRYLVGPERGETDRDAWLVDMGNKIAFVHRLKPDDAGKRKIKYPSIQVAFFDNLDELITASPTYWEEHNGNIHEHIIMNPILNWEIPKIGAGPILEHEDGYIMLYHGANETGYKTGAALLDKTNLRTISRLEKPLIVPEEWYETGEVGGDTKNVTFPSGAVYSKDKKTIQLYYGAADTHVARVDIDVKLLIAGLKKSSVRNI